MHRENSHDERVLVLTPTTKDSSLCSNILKAAEIESTECADLTAVCHELETGAGAILLTEESLRGEGVVWLGEALHREPTWSDLPVVVITNGGVSSPIAHRVVETLGNVALLDRPLRVDTLLSAVRLALHARRRQYQLRNELQEHRRAEVALREREARLSLLWEAAGVLLTANDPEAMLRALLAKIGPNLGVDAYLPGTLDAILNSCGSFASPSEVVR